MGKRDLLSCKIELIAGIGEIITGAVCPQSILTSLLAKGVGIGIKKLLDDFQDRSLSEREKIKIGATFTFALYKINEKINNGERLRDDDFFFANNENYRSQAEEALEGILIKSKNEYQELKIKYLSNIYANIAFSRDSIEDVNSFIKIAEQLTYRQFCMIKCIKNKTINLKKTDDYELAAQIILLQEMYDLNQKGIIEMYHVERKNDSGWTEASISIQTSKGDLEVINSWRDIIPYYLILTDFGEKIYNIMELNEIPEIDIEKRLKVLEE